MKVQPLNFGTTPERIAPETNDLDFANSTPKRKLDPEILALTGLRAVAAIWVVLFHLEAKFSVLARNYPALAYIFPRNGFLGVDLFFVLSGFVIYYNYAGWFQTIRPIPYANFIWMRLARLYPVHLFTLILFVGSVFWLEVHGHVSPHPEFHKKSAILLNVLLIHSWWVPLHVSWNVPAWSISCEWLAYLVFPLFIAFPIAFRSVRSSILVASVSMLAMAAALQWFHNDGNSQYGLLRIAGEFPTGCCLCYLYKRNVAANLNWDVVLPATVAALAGCVYLFHAFGLVSYWAVPLLAMIILGLSYQKGVASRILSSRPFLIGGYISYSLYMTHTFLFTALDKLFPSLEKQAWSVFTDIILGLGFAAGTYYFVEEPSRKRMRRLIRNNRVMNSDSPGEKSN